MRTYHHHSRCKKVSSVLLLFFPVRILPKACGIHLLSSSSVVCGKLIGLLSGAVLVWNRSFKTKAISLFSGLQTGPEPAEGLPSSGTDTGIFSRLSNELYWFSSKRKLDFYKQSNKLLESGCCWSDLVTTTGSCAYQEREKKKSSAGFLWKGGLESQKQISLLIPWTGIRLTCPAEAVDIHSFEKHLHAQLHACSCDSRPKACIRKPHLSPVSSQSHRNAPIAGWTLQQQGALGHSIWATW